jgi:hypothetical protein
MQQNSYRRWITLAIISFSGGVSFDLAYLRYIIKSQWQNSWDLAIPK